MSEVSDETKEKIRRNLKHVPSLKPRARAAKPEPDDDEPEKKTENEFKTRYDKLVELINGARSIYQLKTLMARLKELEASEKATKH